MNRFFANASENNKYCGKKGGHNVCPVVDLFPLYTKHVYVCELFYIDIKYMFIKLMIKKWPKIS